MKKWLPRLAGLFFLGLIAVAALAAWAWNLLEQPFDADLTPISFQIEAGSGASKILNQLSEKQLLLHFAVSRLATQSSDVFQLDSGFTGRFWVNVIMDFVNH